MAHRTKGTAGTLRLHKPRVACGAGHYFSAQRIVGVELRLLPRPGGIFSAPPQRIHLVEGHEEIRDLHGSGLSFLLDLYLIYLPLI
tara:strand:+ start:162 stop:419 length:258 start_codon:yes stop_codon:yes gene_type:complete